MATLTVDKPGLVAAAPTVNAGASGGDVIPNDGKTKFMLDNTSGGSITVTFASEKACDQGADHDIAVAVPAGAKRIIGPIPKDRFDNVSGQIGVTYSTNPPTGLNIYAIGG